MDIVLPKPVASLDKLFIKPVKSYELHFCWIDVLFEALKTRAPFTAITKVVIDR